ncbi:MAG: DUF4058 family protein [Anaerolineales bacterium]
MPSPFPGMDPYLEDKEIWRGFHHHLAEDIIEMLNTSMSDRYYADIEVHTVTQEVGISTTQHIYPDPDAAIMEIKPWAASGGVAVVVPAAPIQRVVMIPGRSRLRSVNVYTTRVEELVTVIEILSPVNKYGIGLENYRDKRRRVFASDVHLVEIDFLRGGTRPGWELNDPPIETDYVLLVNRAANGDGRISEIWPVGLSEPLPKIPVPLLPPDPDVVLDLRAAIENIYERARYPQRIDYGKPVPPPALRPEMETWLKDFRAHFLR